MVHASIDPGLIIYLILVAVWAMSRLAQKKSKRRTPGGAEPPPNVQPRRPPVINDDLREILETLTGQKLEVPPTAPVKPPPTPVEQPQRRRHGTAQPRNVKPPSSVQSRPRELAPQLDQPAADLGVAAVMAPHTPRSSATYVTTTSMKSTALRSSLMGSAKRLSPPEWVPELLHRDSMRKAMLAQLILGPPKSMAP